MKKVFSLMLVLMLVLSLAAPAMAAPKVKTTITLSHSGTVTMNLGQQLQLTATVSPEAPVTWKSSRTKAVAVNASGLVTASAEGTATITAKAGGKSAKVKIKVIDPDKPNKVYIAQGKALTAYVGTPVALGVGYEPTTAKATLTWKTSKAKVAAVDGNGVLTPIAEGKAKITVTTHNKKKATIAVTVVDPNKPTSVTIAQGKSAALISGQTLQLSASVSPATANAALTWKSSNTKVAVVNASGVVTAIGKGTAKITVQDANYKKVKATFTVKVQNNISSDPDKDLSKYIGASFLQTSKVLKVKETHDIPLFESLGTDGLVITAGNKDTDINTAKVDRIGITGKTKYNICGLKVGMKHRDAERILLSKDWVPCNGLESGYLSSSVYEYISTYRKGSIFVWIIYLFNNRTTLEPTDISLSVWCGNYSTW